MNIKYLIPLILIFALFSTQTWAPPTSSGKKEKEKMDRNLGRQESSSDEESAQGAVGGVPALGIDLSKCEIDPRKQRKLRVKGRDGKEHHVCTGEAVCAGKTIPVSCEISERERCPIAKECIVFNPQTFGPQSADPVRHLIFELKPNQKLKYSVRLDTSKASKEPEGEKYAFVLEIKKRSQLIHREYPLKWKSKKIYEILNRDITEKIKIGPQFVNMWSFVGDAQWGYVDLTFELSIDDKVIVRRNFGLHMPRPPRMPDIPDPFPFNMEEPWFPGEGESGPIQQLPDPRRITGNITKILIMKSQN